MIKMLQYNDYYIWMKNVMDKKTTGIVAYITLIGWIIAFCAGVREGAKLHLNQTLVLWIANIAGMVLSFIPFIGWLLNFILGIAILVFWIMGLISAIKDDDKPLPLIGGIEIIK